MEEQPKNSEGNKKKLPRKSVIVFSAIFVALLALIAIFGRFLPQKPEPTQVPSPTQPDISTTTDLNKEYTSALFSFKYPQNWKPQLFNIAGGGNGVTIRPANATDTDYFPRLHIEAAPAKPESSIEKRLELLSWMKLEQSNTTFLGNTAAKLSGIVPFVDKDLKPIDPPVQKTYLFFERAGYLYIVSYAYYEDAASAETEKFFSNILNTLQIQEGAI